MGTGANHVPVTIEQTQLKRVKKVLRFFVNILFFKLQTVIP